MKKLISYTCYFYLLLFNVSISAQNREEMLSILDHPGIRHLQVTLAHIIKDYNMSASGTHHFYIANYKKNRPITYMLWKEGRMLWIMTPGSNSEESWEGIRYPGGGELINLDKDVVDSQKEVGTSTYLVTKSWATQKVYDTVI